ncbi:hypothetical protein WOLCODRAFT_141318 [Wolfiporia cocos MD-104 SS10]|uniref:Zn(2)-C6 fungal-type domain-containing protein n=1 Tax=Wolfiporia cocos (strain MD-104) TaxID=742152 RepID=A0A2H3JBL1_WOLCO|nr:hypothetical protein WOLCODRAFT_141318 [Wolfiporia cocos MD-104 SS10]
MDPQPQQPPAAEPAPSLAGDKPAPKAPVVRGARACTVCRAAKMKCVGADDGNNIPCQRCKRSGSECIFEKHRRGRKPGSRLSEASKMLRRLEKGLNNAKQKSNISDSLTLPPLLDSRSASDRFRDSHGAGTSRFSSNELPPLNLPAHLQEGYPRGNQHTDTEMDEDDDGDQNENGMYPARVIKQNARNSSFFRTILNPDSVDPPTSRSAPGSGRAYSQRPQSPVFSATPAAPSVTSILNSSQPALKDPIDAGLIDEKTVTDLWDMFYIRLNPFINLFDPALHSVQYVRKRSSFLFTALVMACCKFFKPELYQPVLRLAHDFAVRAFAENTKGVEVVQAFACMTYWKEPDDTRTWTYIGYACRMAVELGLNRYVGKRPMGETELMLRERRNRERTYLVLFVHDRSLSMQTGKHWMLPEDDLVRNAATWHEEGGAPIRQEDVIVAAFTQLRHIAAETTDVFIQQLGSGTSATETNYDLLLKNCNSKLNQWHTRWTQEMQRAHGESFHFSMLKFFQLHVRLFLNTFGIQSSSTQPGRPNMNLPVLQNCYSAATDNLRTMADDFARVQMLRYGQDSTTVMTAYSAVVLMKLLRGPSNLAELVPDAVHEIHDMINKTAKAYSDAAHLSPASSSAAYHARFLQSLVANDLDKMKQQQAEQQDRFGRDLPPINTRVQTSHASVSHPVQSYAHGQSQVYAQSGHMDGYYPQPAHVPQQSSVPSASASSSTTSSPYSQPQPAPYDYTVPDQMGRNGALTNYSLSGISTTYAQYQATQATAPNEHDALYWQNMFKDLGVDGAEGSYNQGYRSNTMSESNSSLATTQPAYSGISYRDSHSDDRVYQQTPPHTQQTSPHPSQPVYQYAYASAAYR